jgi:molybdopterin converting factor small subunit
VKIIVKLGAPLSQVVGEKSIILSMPEGATAADVLDKLRDQYPDFDAGLKGKGLRKPLDRILYSLFINARPLPLDRAAATSLKDGDRIYFFLPVAGG